MGHSNFGSTPHSNRLCRFKLCGRAYELPHRSHEYAPPATVAKFSTLKTGIVNGVVVLVFIVVVGGVAAAATAATAAAAAIETAGGINSLKHVAGVRRRRSHG